MSSRKIISLPRVPFGISLSFGINFFAYLW